MPLPLHSSLYVLLSFQDGYLTLQIMPFMSFMYRIHLLVVSVILFAPPSSRRLYTANAQRSAICFTKDNPISCDMETDIVMEDLTEPDWEKLESTCRGIFEEYILPQKLDEFDLSVYPHFFSDLSANTELCRSLKRYFPYCEWCASVSCFTPHPLVTVPTSRESI